MEKQDPFFELITDIITSSIQTICYLSPLAVFLAYFMLKDRVNATTDFFLHWTSISILTVIIGSLLQSISTKYYSTKKRILVALVGAIGQSLIMTYLFATYQPGPDRMSQIHILSWVLFVTVVHIFWVRGDRKDSPYSLIGQSFGIDSTKFTKLITVLSAFGAIGVWIAIAIIMVKQ